MVSLCAQPRCVPVNLIKSFQGERWDAASAYHDADLISLAINTAAKELVLVLEWLPDDTHSSGTRSDSYKFLGVECLSLEQSASPDDAGSNYTFPNNPLVNGFHATGGSEDGHTKFKIQGTYNWSASWYATAFELSQNA